MQWCCVCKAHLPEASFYKPKCLGGRLAGRCIECSKSYARKYQMEHAAERLAYQNAYLKAHPEKRRKHFLKMLYGLSLAGYEALLASQGCVCAICKLPPKDGKVLNVDHDHETDVVRGLLCNGCNCAIGQFEEDPIRLASAIEYLKKAKG